MTDPSAGWLDAEEMRAWLGLVKLSARVVSLTDGELRRTHGITGRDYELLHHLAEATGGCRVSQLAQAIDDTSSCITHRVNRLSTAGFVGKQPDPEDQRARLVTLTRRGRALVARAAPGHAEQVHRLFITPLNRRDLAHLARISHVLNDHLRVVAPPDS